MRLVKNSVGHLQRGFKERDERIHTASGPRAVRLDGKGEVSAGCTTERVALVLVKEAGQRSQLRDALCHRQRRFSDAAVLGHAVVRGHRHRTHALSLKLAVALCDGALTCVGRGASLAAPGPAGPAGPGPAGGPAAVQW